MIERVYLDTCMLLAITSPALYDRLKIVKELLDYVDAGHLQVVTSVAGIVELRKTTNDEGAPATYVDEDAARRILEMIRSNAIDVRPVTERIGLRAREIGERFPAVLALDTIHIATALDNPRSDVLFTFDGAGKRRRPGKMIGLSRDPELATPPLAICPPFIPAGELFDEQYLSGQRVASPEFAVPSELDAVIERMRTGESAEESESPSRETAPPQMKAEASSPSEESHPRA
jgi:hypothetical protein